MKKRLAAVVLSFITLLNMVAPAFAGTFTEDGSTQTLVTAELTSSYSVIVPASIALSDPDKDTVYTADYTLGAKGNINVLKKVTIAPTASSFTMTGNNGQNVTASVTQDVTEWVNKTPGAGQKKITDVETSGTYEDYAITTGSISATITLAGSYSGNVEFTFALGDL